MISNIVVRNGFRTKPGILKQRKNNHRYIKSTTCSCGNNKYKFIKLMNKFQCSKCKKTQGE